VTVTLLYNGNRLLWIIENSLTFKGDGFMHERQITLMRVIPPAAPVDALTQAVEVKEET